MHSQDDEPEIEWNKLTAKPDFRELFRYHKGGDVRVYSLRVVSKGVELWRVTERPSQEPISVREDELASTEEVMQALEDIERSLQAGGWRKF